MILYAYCGPADGSYTPASTNNVQGTLHAVSVFCYLTNSMEQSLSWEANSHSASQEIPRLLWKPKATRP
jgi:hypothetical protein